MDKKAEDYTEFMSGNGKNNPLHSQKNHPSPPVQEDEQEEVKINDDEVINDEVN